MDMDIAILDKALDDEKNASIMNTTHSEIKRKKNDILQKLQIKGVALKAMHATLVGYKYIEDVDELKHGRYIRWISLKRPEKLSLTNGAHVCGVSVDYTEVDNQDEGAAEVECRTCIRCKVVRNGGNVLFFNLNFDETIIFQKITEQEWIILDAIDYLK